MTKTIEDIKRMLKESSFDNELSRTEELLVLEKDAIAAIDEAVQLIAPITLDAYELINRFERELFHTDYRHLSDDCAYTRADMKRALEELGMEVEK